MISTGLFDYLPDADAGTLAAQMCALRAPGGSVVICNFAPCDPSRMVTDWICDWPLIYRDAAQLQDLFAPGHPRGARPLTRARPGLRNGLTEVGHAITLSRYASEPTVSAIGRYSSPT